MTRSTTLTLSKNEENCIISVHEGLLQERQFIETSLKGLGTRIAIITHDSLCALYGESLKQLLTSLGFTAYLFSFPEGEQHKSRETKAFLEDRMLEQGLSRDTVLIALGGGTVTDMGGFIAATYCRGLPLVMIPTSLLGMVDASIGGKTGVNVAQGKNLIGSIYQPSAVWMDTALLHSLPLKERRNGFVEMLKHGLIADADYYHTLECHAEKLLELDPNLLSQVIMRSCEIKTAIVQKDERDKGARALLNYGHTVAHALEKLSHYKLSHGEAVAIGLIVEGQLAVELGYLKQEDNDRVRSTLIKYGLPLRIPVHINVEDCLAAMSMDKKSLNGSPRFALLKGIGIPCENTNMEVKEPILINTLQKMIDDLCMY